MHPLSPPTCTVAHSPHSPILIVLVTSWNVLVSTFLYWWVFLFTCDHAEDKNTTNTTWREHDPIFFYRKSFYLLHREKKDNVRGNGGGYEDYVCQYLRRGKSAVFLSVFFFHVDKRECITQLKKVNIFYSVTASFLLSRHFVKEGGPPNKFRRPQILKLADLPNSLNLRTFRKFGILRIWRLAGPVFFAVWDLRIQFLGGLIKTSPNPQIPNFLFTNIDLHALIQICTKKISLNKPVAEFWVFLPWNGLLYKRPNFLYRSVILAVLW